MQQQFDVIQATMASTRAPARSAIGAVEKFVAGAEPDESKCHGGTQAHDEVDQPLQDWDWDEVTEPPGNCATYGQEEDREDEFMTMVVRDDGNPGGGSNIVHREVATITDVAVHREALAVVPNAGLQEALPAPPHAGETAPRAVAAFDVARDRLVYIEPAAAMGNPARPTSAACVRPLSMPMDFSWAQHPPATSLPAPAPSRSAEAYTCAAAPAAAPKERPSNLAAPSGRPESTHANRAAPPQARPSVRSSSARVRVTITTPEDPAAHARSAAASLAQRLAERQAAALTPREAAALDLPETATAAPEKKGAARACNTGRCTSADGRGTHVVKTPTSSTPSTCTTRSLATPLNSLATDTGANSGAAVAGIPKPAAATHLPLQLAVAQHRADSLFERRKYWYKPVAIVGGVCYSIAEGEAVVFVMGKRMLTYNEGQTRRARNKPGYLVYDCASRALQAALYRPKGKLAAATKAVLRVTASRSCAPDHARWPTCGGVWAFEVIVPVAIAIEQQAWMDDKALAPMWVPSSPPGLCKQCALGERVCIQIRNHLELGQPPHLQPASVRARALAKERVPFLERGTIRDLDPDVHDPDVVDDEWELPAGHEPSLDLRSFV